MQNGKLNGLKMKIRNREKRLSDIKSLLERGVIAVVKPYQEERTKLIGELAELYMQKKDLEITIAENKG